METIYLSYLYNPSVHLGATEPERQHIVIHKRVVHGTKKTALGAG